MAYRPEKSTPRDIPLQFGDFSPSLLKLIELSESREFLPKQMGTMLRFRTDASEYEDASEWLWARNRAKSSSQPYCVSNVVMVEGIQGEGRKQISPPGILISGAWFTDDYGKAYNWAVRLDQHPSGGYKVGRVFFNGDHLNYSTGLSGMENDPASRDARFTEFEENFTWERLEGSFRKIFHGLKTHLERAIVDSEVALGTQKRIAESIKYTINRPE